MTDKIEVYLEDEHRNTNFIIVGLGHILGSEGVATLLQERG
ncbi:TraB/GumN family protein [Aureibacillus halotolerans]|nr:TraB/GumN family protein [Aureibacillus halotolerans]